MNIPSNNDVSRYCGESHNKIIACSGLASTIHEDGRFFLIRPTTVITRDMLEYFWSKMADEENGEFPLLEGFPMVPLIVGRAVHYSIMKMYEAIDVNAFMWPINQGALPANIGYERTDPEGLCIGKFAHFMRRMPRYNFDPVMGFVEVTPEARLAYNIAQYEVVCFASPHPELRRSLMVERMAYRVFAPLVS